MSISTDGQVAEIPPSLDNEGASTETYHFSVDAALLRELGERLIGQPQIALAELIKNAYDADASTCRVTFGADSIEIADDGHGMTRDDFVRYWLRLGSTHKLDERRSQRLGRSFTGSKGIGRLAVQFLAAKMEMETRSDAADPETLTATVNWLSIESGKNIETVAVQVVREPYVSGQSADPFPNQHPFGTRIRLTSLRDDWDTERIRGLGRRIWVLRSPFRRRVTSPITRGPEDFDVEVEAPDIVGAKEALDEILDALFDNWKARIHGSLEDGRRLGEATITLEFKAGYPDGQPAERFQESVRVPVVHQSESQPSSLLDRIEFEILVFKLERRQSGGILVGELRDYLEDFGNVSIYDAGFRLPYYGAHQDWLGTEADHARRLSVSDLLPARLGITPRYMLDLPETRRIFGVVDLNTNWERHVAERRSAAPDEMLQLSPGRDRLHDNRAHGQLRDLVRYSLDFYANRYAARNARGIDLRRDSEPATAKQERAIAVLEANEAEIPQPVFREVRREVREALAVARTTEDEMDRRAALLAPLASAGMVALALNHELARERQLLGRSISTLRRIAIEHRVPGLDAIADDFQQMAERLNAIQDLFGPLLSEADTTATDRLRVRSIVENVVRGLRPIMGGLKFDVSGVPSDLRFPVGSFSEWSAVIQNVVTNAWNATLTVDHPVVSFVGGTDRRGEWLRINDTGIGLGVQLDEAVQLFEPFDRRLQIPASLRSIAMGGQGLGLTIVRMIAARRKVAVAFVAPTDGFSTAFELRWKV